MLALLINFKYLKKKNKNKRSRPRKEPEGTEITKVLVLQGWRTTVLFPTFPTVSTFNSYIFLYNPQNKKMLRLCMFLLRDKKESTKQGSERDAVLCLTADLVLAESGCPLKQG